MVRRIPIKPLPEDEIEGAEWLQDLFRQKDKMQDSFHKHGDFFHDTGVKPVQGVLQKPSMSCLINMIVWSFVTLAPIMFYLTKLLFSGELVYFSIGAGILTACKSNFFLLFFFDFINFYFYQKKIRLKNVFFIYCVVDLICLMTPMYKSLK